MTMRDVTCEPVIGIVETEPITYHYDGKEHLLPTEALEVIEVVQHGEERIFIINRWYKPGVPQIIHERMVQKYTPISSVI
jgi:hypothetical protein